MRAAAAAILLALLPGCLGASEGALSIDVTAGGLALDAFTSIVVPLSNVVVPTYEGEIATGTVRLAPAREAVELVAARDTPVGVLHEGALEEGAYRSFSLYVGDATGTLADGATVTLRAPEGRLQFRAPFRVAEGETTTLRVPIDAVREGEGYALAVGR